MKNSATQISRIFALKLFLPVVLFLTTLTNALATATVDTTFGANGRTTITLGDSQRIGGVAIQNNDKIIVAGDVLNNATGRDGVIVRYNSNGTLDQSFGSGGRIVFSASPRDDSFYAVAVQTDGKIVVVGSVSPTEGSTNTDFLIVRFNENGSLDSGFGNGGIITVNQGSQDSLHAVKIQPDGKIVAVGGTSDSGGRGAVFRLNPNGTFDSSFSGGIVLIDRPQYTDEVFYSLGFYANNRILIGGDGFSSSSRSGLATLLESNGTIVENFGNGGFLSVSLSSPMAKILVKVLPNGNFVAGTFNPDIYTSDGIRISSLVPKNVTDIAFLSNGNLVVLSVAGQYVNENGIRIYNKNLQLVGSDDWKLTSEFSGTQLNIQSNDKIIILREDGVLLRLNGISSIATRIFGSFPFYRTAFAVYRPSNRTVYVLSNVTNSFSTFQTDAIPSQFIPENPFFEWYAELQPGALGYFVQPTGNGNQTAFQWGASGDVAVGGDYDGDGFTDFTVFRPSNGTWYIFQSSNNQARAFQFGQAGDKLVPADYDYDGITDFAVFRPSNGTWYISRSSDNGFRAVQFGVSGDIPVAGDYDGDGRADFVVFRPSTGVWYLLKSQEGFSAVQFGISTDQPVPGDYDGDGRHDIAVFRAGFWHIRQSRDGLRSIQWGLPGDIPISVRY